MICTYDSKNQTKYLISKFNDYVRDSCFVVNWWKNPFLENSFKNIYIGVVLLIASVILVIYMLPYFKILMSITKERGIHIKFTNLGCH